VYGTVLCCSRDGGGEVQRDVCEFAFGLTSCRQYHYAGPLCPHVAAKTFAKLTLRSHALRIHERPVISLNRSDVNWLAKRRLAFPIASLRSRQGDAREPWWILLSSTGHLNASSEIQCRRLVGHTSDDGRDTNRRVCFDAPAFSYSLPRERD
jgi:hypothetical protein